MSSLINNLDYVISGHVKTTLEHTPMECKVAIGRDLVGVQPVVRSMYVDGVLKVDIIDDIPTISYSDFIIQYYRSSEVYRYSHPNEIINKVLTTSKIYQNMYDIRHVIAVCVTVMQGLMNNGINSNLIYGFVIKGNQYIPYTWLELSDGSVIDNIVDGLDEKYIVEHRHYIKSSIYDDDKAKELNNIMLNMFSDCKKIINDCKKENSKITDYRRSFFNKLN